MRTFLTFEIVLALLWTASPCVAGEAPSASPPYMRWIDGGAFVMGADDARSMAFAAQQEMTPCRIPVLRRRRRLLFDK
jgi:hypothetical protein